MPRWNSGISDENSYEVYAVAYQTSKICLGEFGEALHIPPLLVFFTNKPAN